MNAQIGRISEERVGQPGTGRPALIGLILVLFLAYTWMQVLMAMGRLNQPLKMIVEFIPGLLGVAILLRAGFTLRECFLLPGRLSRKGLLALLLTLPLMVPVILAGRWIGWSWQEVLVYSTANTTAQELFFRCSLLPLSFKLFSGKVYLPVFLAALLFGFWHVDPLAQGQPAIAVLSVILVPFLSGLAWNWQVNRDRTVLWVLILHILDNWGMTLFTYG